MHVTPVVDYTRYDWDSPGASRRSVYRFLFRTLPDPFFDALDSADASQLTAVRNESTTPFRRWCCSTTRSCCDSASSSPPGSSAAPDAGRRLDAAVELVLGRRPCAEEAEALAGYAAATAGEPCRLMFNSNEFLYVN